MVKAQPYSLQDTLANDDTVDQFVEATGNPPIGIPHAIPQHLSQHHTVVFHSLQLYQKDAALL